MHKMILSEITQHIDKTYTCDFYNYKFKGLFTFKNAKTESNMTLPEFINLIFTSTHYSTEIMGTSNTYKVDILKILHTNSVPNHPWNSTWNNLHEYVTMIFLEYYSQLKRGKYLYIQI